MYECIRSAFVIYIQEIDRNNSIEKKTLLIYSALYANIHWKVIHSIYKLQAPGYVI